VSPITAFTRDSIGFIVVITPLVSEAKTLKFEKKYRIIIDVSLVILIL
jgi:hypothetical protein